MKKTNRLAMDVQAVSKLDPAGLHKLHRETFGFRQTLQPLPHGSLPAPVRKNSSGIIGGGFSVISAP